MDNNLQLLLLLFAVIAILVFALRRGRPRDGARGQPVPRHRARAGSAVPAFREASATASARGTDSAPMDARYGNGDAGSPEPAFEPRPPLPALEAFELLRRATLDEEAEAQLQAAVRGLKQPHPMLGRITSGLDDPEELGRIVRSDPGLSAEVLRTVNSAAFALSTPIASVNHALTFLGSNVVKSLVTHAAIAPSLQLDTELQRSAVDRLWRASYLASIIAQLAGRELALPRPSVLATEALLSNLGDVALIARRPELAEHYLGQCSLLEQVQAQQTLCGLNGAVVAAALAQQWQLPEELGAALENLLLPLVCAPENLPVRGEARRQLLVCYSACRLGWWLVSQGIDDIAAVDLAALEAPEFHYLPEHLHAAGLEEMLRLCAQPGFRHKVNPLLQQLVNAEAAE